MLKLYLKKNSSCKNLLNVSKFGRVGRSTAQILRSQLTTSHAMPKRSLKLTFVIFWCTANTGKPPDLDDISKYTSERNMTKPELLTQLEASASSSLHGAGAGSVVNRVGQSMSVLRFQNTCTFHWIRLGIGTPAAVTVSPNPKLGLEITKFWRPRGSIHVPVVCACESKLKSIGNQGPGSAS